MPPASTRWTPCGRNKPGAGRHPLAGGTDNARADPPGGWDRPGRGPAPAGEGGSGRRVGDGLGKGSGNPRNTAGGWTPRNGAGQHGCNVTQGRRRRRPGSPCRGCRSAPRPGPDRLHQREWPRSTWRRTGQRPASGSGVRPHPRPRRRTGRRGRGSGAARPAAGRRPPPGSAGRWRSWWRGRLLPPPARRYSTAPACSRRVATVAASSFAWAV